MFSCFGSFFLSAAAAVAPWFDFGSVRSVRSRFKYKFKYTFCWCHVMGVSVGEFAVVGMASFDLVWFEWLRGVQARDCGDSGVVFKQEIVEIVVGVLCAIVVGLVLGCLVVRFSSIQFHQCPQQRSLCPGWLVQSAAR